MYSRAFLIMSLLYRTHEKTDLEHRDYGFVLALICVLLVASAIFALLPVGREISSQMSLVGP
jgi:hypothetical protein